MYDNANINVDLKVTRIQTNLEYGTRHRQSYGTVKYQYYDLSNSAITDDLQGYFN